MEKPEKNKEYKEGEPKLEIVFGLEEEIQRVDETIKNLPWFEEHGYAKWLKLPQHLSQSSSPEDISNSVSTEFNASVYKEYVDSIETEFPEIEKKLDALKTLVNFDLRDRYTIKLTRYGTGGSYNVIKSLVILNIQRKSKAELLGTIIHEITHIGIEDLIQKYNVKQWQKERIIDLITERLFPGLHKNQDYQADVSSVETIFNNFYPDMDAIIKNVGETK